MKITLVKYLNVWLGICDEFFGPLFRGMDVLQYVLYDTAPLDFDEECLNIFSAAGFTYNHSVSQHLCDALEKAGYSARQCRIRLPITIDIQLLRNTLRRAEPDRLHCIDTHPLYNTHPQSWSIEKYVSQQLKFDHNYSVVLSKSPHYYITSNNDDGYLIELIKPM